jgi:hypothetical protein
MSGVSQSIDSPNSSAPPTVAPAELVLAAAITLLPVRERGGANRGEMVELMLKAVGLAPGQPWCAAFVYYCGHWALRDLEHDTSRWPLPRSGSCWVLGNDAKVRDALREAPTRGAVFLLYDKTLGRFAHTGFVTRVVPTDRGWVCTTIEGNTNDDGSREGTRVCAKTRTFLKGAAHRFIAWETLL